MTPQRVGWYWFLPDTKCPTTTGCLRLDKPVVLLVGVDKVTRDMPPARFVVRFPQAVMYVDDMSGDWEPIEEPKRMKQESMNRIMAQTVTAPVTPQTVETDAMPQRVSVSQQS